MATRLCSSAGAFGFLPIAQRTDSDSPRSADIARSRCAGVVGREAMDSFAESRTINSGSELRTSSRSVGVEPFQATMERTFHSESFASSRNKLSGAEGFPATPHRTR